MANYTDQLVVVDSGVIKKVSDGDNLILSGNLELGPESTLTIQSTGSIKHLNVLENLDVTGNAIVTGDLTVNGTTTTINSTTISVDDKNIELGSVDTPTDVTADEGGITLKGATDKTLKWVNSTDSWTSSENFDLATGKDYNINDTSVLSSTTLGSGVVNSSLTSVGTIATGVWQGTAIADTYVANDLTIVGGTVNNSVIGGTTPAAGTFTTLTGTLGPHQLGGDIVDIADHDGSSKGLHLAGTLVTSTAAELNLLDGNTTVGVSITLADADGFVVNDGGSMKTIPASDIKDYIGSGGSVAADNITLGDGAVSIETTNGGIDLSSTGSITLDTDGAVLVEAEDGIGRTFTGYHASSGAQADLNNNLLLSGTILTYGDDTEGTPWALTHAYGGSHTYVAGVNMSDAAIGDPTTLQATASMNLHVSQGFPTYVRFRSSDLPLSNTDQGQLCYLGQADYGLAQMDVPSAGNIVRLGILMSTASNGGLYQVLWQPQFIASL